MSHSNKKIFLGGIAFGLGVMTMFSLVTVVFGVTSGSVINPTFGPQGNDVDSYGAPKCVVRAGTNNAECGPNEQLMGAGGECNENNSDQLRVQSDTQGGVNGTGHVSVSCSPGGAGRPTFAICCTF